MSEPSNTPLPEEILELVLGIVDVRTLLSVVRTSQTLRRIALPRLYAQPILVGPQIKCFEYSINGTSPLPPLVNTLELSWTKPTWTGAVFEILRRLPNLCKLDLTLPCSASEELYQWIKYEKQRAKGGSIQDFSISFQECEGVSPAIYDRNPNFNYGEQPITFPCPSHYIHPFLLPNADRIALCVAPCRDSYIGTDEVPDGCAGMSSVSDLSVHIQSSTPFLVANILKIPRALKIFRYRWQDHDADMYDVGGAVANGLARHIDSLEELHILPSRMMDTSQIGSLQAYRALAQLTIDIQMVPVPGGTFLAEAMPPTLQSFHFWIGQARRMTLLWVLDQVTDFVQRSQTLRVLGFHKGYQLDPNDLVDQFQLVSGPDDENAITRLKEACAAKQVEIRPFDDSRCTTVDTWEEEEEDEGEAGDIASGDSG